jgi:hypothetical protein
MRLLADHSKGGAKHDDQEGPTGVTGKPIYRLGACVNDSSRLKAVSQDCGSGLCLRLTGVEIDRRERHGRGCIRHPGLSESLHTEPSLRKRGTHAGRETRSVCSVQNKRANLARRHRMSGRRFCASGRAGTNKNGGCDERESHHWESRNDLGKVLIACASVPLSTLNGGLVGTGGRRVRIAQRSRCARREALPEVVPQVIQLRREDLSEGQRTLDRPG